MRRDREKRHKRDGGGEAAAPERVDLPRSRIGIMTV